MQEDARRRAIQTRLGRSEPFPPRTAIPTGFETLDAACGAGLPRGSIVELFGPSGSGKTSIALQIVAAVQRRRGSAAWIDAEHAFDPSYAVQLGADPEKLPVLQPDTAEQALDIAVRLVASGALDLVVIDSAAALIPEAELQVRIGEASPALQSRVLGAGLRRLAHAVAKGDSSVLFVNQVRVRPESSTGEGETTAGGPSLKLHAALRIGIAPTADRSVRLRILKNKASGPFRQAVLWWKTGSGFVETP